MTAYAIRMGVPEMEDHWNDISSRSDANQLNAEEMRYFKKLVKTLGYLSANPRHPGLESHEIDDLSRRYGLRVWQSYLENKTPSAGRIFWVYGPDRGEITVIGIEPHPEDKKRGAYDRIPLSRLR
ncbi:MAG: hypothetical protein WCI20_15455 [bacterium]